jgi:hypothetical protein
MSSYLDTRLGVPIRADYIHDFFRGLVNNFFKILPMWENNEETLPVYLQSLQVELLGLQELISSFKDSSAETAKPGSDYVALLAILQRFIDESDMRPEHVRREVFKAISLCNRICSCLSGEVVS